MYVQINNSDAGTFFFIDRSCALLITGCGNSLFGTKWTKLHGGPMWCVDSTGQDGTDGENRNFIPAEVLAIHTLIQA